MPRRQINLPLTLQNYKERLQTFPDSDFSDLHDAYLSSFEVYSTWDRIEEGSMLDCFVATLHRETVRRGFLPLGITSERKHSGEYICNTFGDGRDRTNTNVVYCGKFSYFSGHAKSKFAPIQQDNVYDDA